MRRLPPSVISWFAALAFTPAAAVAQSFNIDINPPGVLTVPASTYGAAGSPGLWNAGFGNAPLPLVARDGSATGVTLGAQGGFGGQVFAVPGTSGNDALFLTDGQVTTDVLHAFQFAGLRNGNYSLTLYGITGSHTTTFFGVNGSTYTLDSNGWTGSFIEGLTHIVVPVTVTNGTLDFTVVGSFGRVGFFNGLQLSEVPAPGSALVLGAAGILGAGRRARRESQTR